MNVERDAIKPLARGAPYGVDHHVRPICASDRHAAGEGPEAERPAGVELDDAIDAFGLGLSLRARRAERTGEYLPAPKSLCDGGSNYSQFRGSRGLRAIGQNQMLWKRSGVSFRTRYRHARVVQSPERRLSATGQRRGFRCQMSAVQRELDAQEPTPPMRSTE